jgi:hypothetical protein
MGEATGVFGADGEQSATASFEEAIRIFRGMGHDRELARTYSALADHCQRAGDWKAGDRYQALADELFRRLSEAPPPEEIELDEV